MTREKNLRNRKSNGKKKQYYFYRWCKVLLTAHYACDLTQRNIEGSFYPRHKVLKKQTKNRNSLVPPQFQTGCKDPFLAPIIPPFFFPVNGPNHSWSKPAIGPSSWSVFFAAKWPHCHHLSNRFFQSVRPFSHLWSGDTSFSCARKAETIVSGSGFRPSAESRL